MKTNDSHKARLGVKSIKKSHDYFLRNLISKASICCALLLCSIGGKFDYTVEEGLKLEGGLMSVHAQEENPNFEKFRNFYLGEPDSDNGEFQLSSPVPDWLGLSYRFLAITVGSLPISLLATGIGYDTYRTIDYNQTNGEFDPAYLPLGLGGDTPPYTQEDTNRVLAYSAYVSLGIATVDLILSLIFRSRQRRAQRLLTEQ